MLLDPVLVAATVEGAGHDTNGVFTGLHHGEVGVEAAVGVEPWGVGRGADALTDLVDSEVLGKVASARARELEYLEWGEIEQASVLTHVEVLANGDRAPPAVVPLNFTLRKAIALNEVSV